MTHIRNSYEAEDISTYDRARTIGNSTGSLCGIGGDSSSSVPTCSSRYYSPPGTSYTIVERSHSPHSYYNSAGDCQTVSASKSRGLYLESLTQNGQKKRPISPERMFPAASLSTPNSYHHLHTNGRNSPPITSSSHQIYHRSGRGDRSMVTRTVTMCRDQQPDGTQGFGICVKGGRETGSWKSKAFLKALLLCFFDSKILFGRNWSLHFSHRRKFCSREIGPSTRRHNPGSQRNTLFGDDSR